MTDARAFRGFRFPAEIILWAVRWYLQFPISYRDLALMLADRGVEVDHTTIYRWIQAYAPELDERIRPHLRLTTGPWRVNETHVRVKGRWMGTVKLMLARREKRRRSSALWPYAAASVPVISARIANACARTARYSVAGR